MHFSRISWSFLTCTFINWLILTSLIQLLFGHLSLPSDFLRRLRFRFLELLIIPLDYYFKVLIKSHSIDLINASSIFGIKCTPRSLLKAGSILLYLPPMISSWDLPYIYPFFVNLQRTSQFSLPLVVHSQFMIFRCFTQDWHID